MHSHDDGHSHAHSSEHAAEEGRAGHLTDEGIVTDEDGRVADLLPEAVVARYRDSTSEPLSRRIRFGREDGDREGECSTPTERFGNRATGRRERRTPGSNRHGRLTSIDDISIHPASFRQEIIAASRPQLDDESSSDSNPDDETAVLDDASPRESTPLLKGNAEAQVGNGATDWRSTSKRSRRNSTGVHRHHNHNKPKKAGKKHGHSHGDMGMNAMVLHVIGDALGNVGVIVTALIIWLTDWPGRFYADPAVSLFITLIILRSALPLTVAASKILLQATPDNINLTDVREDIQALPGVISCHHVHIWQLSDTKVVASMHIQVAFPISEASGEKYMELSKMARKCLHAYGIHSATIQPEFCTDATHAHLQEVAAAAVADMGLDGSAAAAALQGEADLCLLDCVDDCIGQGCCSPSASRPESSHSGDGHGHGHEHEHEGHDH